ncbi:TIGR03857 family LLM class F420-dependent oxidoreductase [Mycobacterium sp. pUA109]|uniref:TIGR03857 family LLM class F420-dependent oxidoreductase n=1 Tax=Mycobacterium sp. pUA109 TaxID=3238982 RepID=UPI00351AB751
MTAPTTAAATAPVIEDLSAYVIAGRVKARPSPESETAARTPAQGVDDGVQAEQIGFRRVFLSERWNLKEAGALLGGIAARTTRIGVGTGVIPPAARHPLHAAGFASTMHGAYGPRFVLGLGRGDNDVMRGLGMWAANFDALRDYVSIVRRLWDGETVSYDGPAGHYPKLALPDLHDGPHPQIWFGTFGLPKAAQVVAECMDGILLVPNMTPDATRAAVQRLREACERIGRDPATLRIAQCVVTAPELDDIETRQIVHARALTYLESPGWGRSLCRLNGWDPAVLDTIAAHEQLRGADVIADARYHRSELMEPAKLVPEGWMRESAAYGSIGDCLTMFERFRDAGADELVTYGSTPGQNATLAHAWANGARHA